jgi:hypothetical protein
MNTHIIIRLIMALTVGSGILAVTVSVTGALIPMLEAPELIGVFVESFRLGIAALVGMIVGRA